VTYKRQLLKTIRNKSINDRKWGSGGYVNLGPSSGALIISFAGFFEVFLGTFTNRNSSNSKLIFYNNYLENVSGFYDVIYLLA
jgi:hypothetical protein